ncbi:MAG: 3-oxoacyl-ACP reductase FabG [Ruminobacter sp.]|uniref:3-oxoacyl-ACP reductase FabG n=1 Tax=Ruminobacter sp. TaxID=2774296 RepID=UPI002579C76F|nr:3-oxoacyl-ACP reductase FabG [Ruminobacter sp.]MBQ3775757.1 3-oxoacyl-ACP reductase FabG [Ruminobacter sp.]
MADKNRRVLISGASSDIGQAVAAKLADMGFSLALHCHSERGLGELEKLIMELKTPENGSHVILRFDVADRQSTRDLIEADIEKNGAYWGVVSNAGITDDGPMPGMSGESWDRVLTTNLDGFYNVVQPTLMPMIRLRNGGRIVAVASVSGMVGNRGQTNYSASKAGIIAACKSLALELGKRKITVNSVSPGIIETKMVSEEVIEHALPLVPLNRLGKTEEVAALIGFLFSDDAGYITRQNISINGGMC